MRKIFFLATTLLISLSCSQPLENKTKKMDVKLKYLALGDSYTIGESVTEVMRFPVILAAELKNKGIILDEVKIIAKTGWTTDELKSALIDSAITETYDYVSFHYVY